MAQRTTRVNGRRLETAVTSIEREFGRLQKELRSRGRDIEKRLEKTRRQLESRGRKQFESLLAELRRRPVVKRAQALRRDAEKQIVTLRRDAERQIESGVETVLGRLQIASKRDVERIDKKLQTLTKKLVGSDKPSRRQGEPRSAASA